MVMRVIGIVVVLVLIRRGRSLRREDPRGSGYSSWKPVPNWRGRDGYRKKDGDSYRNAAGLDYH